MQSHGTKTHIISNKTKTLFITLKQLAKTIDRFFEVSYGSSFVQKY